MARYSGPESGDILTILAEFERAGYRTTDHQTKKLAEFEAPSGEIVYVIKTSSRLNQINLAVHPELNRQTLVGLSGVESVEDEFFFNSNMTRFPKRLNTGKSPNHRALQVHISTLGSLGQFLRAFGPMGR